MTNSIKLRGVSTHNLKNIDINIIKNSVTTIFGRSGAGKSSLAYSSLYKVCSDEFDALENGYSENGNYSIDSYSGIIPAVAISQHNNNNNPRSTLYSYLNLSHILSFMTHKYPDKIPKYEYLKLNKLVNECPFCKGLGENNDIYLPNILNIEKSIEENAFTIWSNGSFADLYQKLLLAYCIQEHIPINVPFKQLNKIDQHKLLYGQSSEKLQIKFKYRNVYRTRKICYEGAILFAESFVLKNSNSRLTTKNICKSCLGSRINIQRYQNISIFNIIFKDFLTIPISSILDKLKHMSASEELLSILGAICELGLGYLSLSRSIPSLSGGELQKLKFSRLLTSNISGVLFVIDEISAQLNPDDFPKILSYIRKLSKNNTIVLIEHAEFFIKNSDYRIHIGPYPGVLGGMICNSEEIISPIENKIKPYTTNSFIEFDGINKNNVINQKVKIPVNAITLFMGPSGSGKSSIARYIEMMSDVIYISQKSSNFNYRSVLASSLKVNNLIAEMFEKGTNISAEKFNLSQTGGCIDCSGTGLIKYSRGYDKDIYITCPTCEGKLFDPYNIVLNEKVNGLTIVDFYNTEISILIDYIDTKNKSLYSILDTVINLGLGHLTLNRKTQTLSGGEIHRIKLCENLSRIKRTNKLLIVDEPIAGLDPETASKVLAFIHSKRTIFKSIILIEHRKEVMNYVDYLVTIGPGSGYLGGKVISQSFVKS